MKQVLYSKSAVKIVRRMPSNEANRIASKIEQFAVDPESLANNITGIAGTDYIRLRVGDWRVIIRESDSTIYIDKIATRGGAYDKR
ncbi:MAG: type II toxin-antitoxin system RelE/ParE family toxin [Rhizobiales bacterium]|nr:type II toxin-antitoxin system RelE/ParE family toxin [Hyphomicrobiales bacterium]